MQTDSNPCIGYACRWPGEVCRVDGTGRAQCLCMRNCPKVIVPVCGSDDVTYDSPCHLEQAACAQKRDIWIVYAGQCCKQ
ncbi:unnamed protein product [Protopolystoma xenopodis]|uniref:Kazal-like domain-containing protein n=1 Tax=Protopolystoma xenopodis TaxID=117903 RepID=A0A3S5CFW8_9PLAT|nr:unnamed protein product [Protopolystoma xenopodis]